jgi:hypothetical protein
LRACLHSASSSKASCCLLLCSRPGMCRCKLRCRLVTPCNTRVSRVRLRIRAPLYVASVSLFLVSGVSNPLSSGALQLVPMGPARCQECHGKRQRPVGLGWEAGSTCRVHFAHPRVRLAHCHGVVGGVHKLNIAFN